MAASAWLGAQGKDFYTVNKHFGVNINWVSSVCTDSEGFVWASAKSCIMRIMAEDLKTYRLPYVSLNIQTVKLSYSAGSLLAFTNDGQLFRYNPVSDSFEFTVNFTEALEQEYLTISAVCVCNDSVLFASSSEGIYRYVTGGSPTLVKAKENTDLNWAMTAIGDSLLMVSSVDGLGIIDMSTSGYTEILKADARLNAESLLYVPDNSKDGSGTVWIGSLAHGLLYFDIKDFKAATALNVVAGFSRQPVLALERYDDGHIIAGINGEGVCCIDSDTHTIWFSEKKNSDTSNAIPDNGVGGICCTDEVVWVATWKGGLCFFNREPSAIFRISHRQYDSNSLISNDVSQTLTDPYGNIWVATSMGLDVYNPDNSSWRHLLSDKNCISLAQDSMGQVWVGTFGDGYHVFDSRTYSEKPGGRDCLYAMAIASDSEGDVWVTGVQNITCIHPDGSSIRYHDMSVRGIAEYADGRMALACAHALVLLDKKSGAISKVEDGLMLDVTACGDTLFVAASGQGVLIYVLSSGEKSYLTEGSGLSSNFPTSLELADGILWIGTENGVNRYDVCSGRLASFQGVPELSNLNCNVNAIGRIDGQLALGTPDGLYIFDPARTVGDIRNAGIWIDDYLISGISIHKKEKIQQGITVNDIDHLKLAYNENDLLIDWLPVGTGYNMARLLWNLDGTGEWNTARKQGLSLLNIPTGRHTLTLRLQDIMTESVLEEREIALCVMPPFWLSWWFLLLAAALLAYIILISLGYYTSKIRQEVVPIVSINRAVDAAGKTGFVTGIDIADNGSRQAQTDYNNPFVQEAIAVVQRNMQNPAFDKDLFASEMNISPSLLYKKLKALSGQSPTDFIRTIRMGQALKLLQEGRYSVTEVSELCGYSSAAYFSTVFKSFYGKPPTQI